MTDNGWNPEGCFDCSRLGGPCHGHAAVLAQWHRALSGEAQTLKVEHDPSKALGAQLDPAAPFTSQASEVSCRCGLYVGACPLHDHDYRTDAEKAIEADRAARAKGPAR